MERKGIVLSETHCSISSEWHLFLYWWKAAFFRRSSLDVSLGDLFSIIASNWNLICSFNFGENKTNNFLKLLTAFRFPAISLDDKSIKRWWSIIQFHLCLIQSFLGLLSFALLIISRPIPKSIILGPNGLSNSQSWSGKRLLKLHVFSSFRSILNRGLIRLDLAPRISLYSSSIPFSAWKKCSNCLQSVKADQTLEVFVSFSNASFRGSLASVSAHSRVRLTTESLIYAHGHSHFTC